MTNCYLTLHDKPLDPGAYLLTRSALSPKQFFARRSSLIPNHWDGADGSQMNAVSTRAKDIGAQMLMVCPFAAAAALHWCIGGCNVALLLLLHWWV